MASVTVLALVGLNALPCSQELFLGVPPPPVVPKSLRLGEALLADFAPELALGSRNCHRLLQLLPCL